MGYAVFDKDDWICLNWVNEACFTHEDKLGAIRSNGHTGQLPV